MERSADDYRPSTGSCARCRDALGLASVKRDGVWYCSPACADGRVEAHPRPPAVPEPWLYLRPRRFLRKRRPIELKSSRAGS